MTYLGLRMELLRRLLTWQGWMDAPSSRRTKAWGAAVRALSPNQSGPGALDRFEQVLPRLPLPSIEETLQTFIASVDPLLDATGRAEVRAAADQFRGSDTAAYLQARLETRRALHENWLAEYWEHYAYLIDRRSLLYSTGYTVDSPTMARLGVSQLQQAAMTTVALLDIRRRLAAGQVAPQRIQGVVPLCMKQLRNCYSTVRLPGIDVDTIERFDDQRAIVVLVNGHFFEVEVIFDEGRRDISYPQLLAALEEIQQVATALPPGPPIPALTLEQRDVWSRVRAGLIRDGGVNADSLDRIERALLVVILDDAEPEGLTELGRTSLCGTGANRWLDKSMNLVVFANGRTGGIMEHSRGDGEAMMLLWEERLLYERRFASAFDQKPTPPPSPPRRLVFEVTPTLDRAISAAVANARTLIDDVDVYADDLGAAGAAAIKAARCSPDAFIQLALQLAYGRLHPDRGPCLTYETATTRLFAAGRTECLRSATAQSRAFVLAMMDPTCTGARRARLLRAAASAHRANRLQAMRGRGCDRHLLGLFIEALREGKDVALFGTDAWSLPFELATSQSPVRQTAAWRPESSSRGVGFLPITQTGYGVSYAFVGDDDVYLFVSASNGCDQTSAQRFCDAVGAAMRDMLRVLSGHAELATPPAPAPELQLQ
ncbi:Choline/Carnitine o-acyltransferase [Mycobacterium marinum]|uniref:choline/carnitine O-acyltransferase n=1 Tax=Mycobacterium marinum TaxID=1781 RepID=UPI000E28B0EA|nr:choline/carnitine O-acyltransferase [Mycobacterium marinum]AXN42599.1 Choline/Carnitine o-acyltransferase [Mycobacterium marinum]RFZ06826.1 Choline/Carnitine o-acyltransferase [Mycobacterium marinum]RFZ08328.1 Choline/Carnitine o-acyltransferase [Mycobacterium marinum]RFZ13528.1 Choline/Carnitine o-acyltransferase [Mycobacterium marinum]RFZ50149.1 Choline/Carnitine o-acyltransferase [Mycobacterium marinum]